MEFEADPIKAAENFKKHKVSFEERHPYLGIQWSSLFLTQIIPLAKCAGCRLVCPAEGEFLLLFTRSAGAKFAWSARE